LKTLDHGVGPAITFTRGTNATYFDATGTLRFAPNNHIRNSQASGSTNGVIGSGGVMPTNWFVGTASGITREVIGTGTANGFAYVDVKLSGTNSSGSAVGFNIGYDGTTQVNAAAAQTWTSSVYVSLTAGDLTGISTIRLSTIEYKADGTFLVSGNGSALSIAALMSRFAHTRTLTDALTERVWTGILVTVAGSATIDLTLRIAAPQLEIGSTATDYNPTTGTAYFGPRFDHSGGSSLGLLIEEARTNLYQRSAEFDNAYWNKTRASITANALASPDGTMSADLLVEDNTASNSHFVFRQVAHAGANSTVTVSVFAKAKERDRLSVSVLSGITTPTIDLSGGTVVFNLAAGTAGSFSGSQTGTASNGTGNAAIASVGNGWYRCTITLTPAGVTATDTQVYFGLHNGTSSSYTGDNTSGLYIWGAQLEAGAFATSYIPTTTAAATRAADSAVVTPISSFYNQSEGTLFAEVQRDTLNTNLVTIASLDDNTLNNRVAMGLQGGSGRRMRVTIVTATASQWDEFNAGNSSVWPTRVIVAYKASDFAATVQGGAVVSQASGTVPTATHLYIGNRGGSALLANSHIRRIAYWPRRLSNSLLQQLTT
jgi:hypothetical protein